MSAQRRSDDTMSLEGGDLRKAFQAAARCLERHRDAINALNVFPVPDGDTGTNMLLTMRSVNEECSEATGSSAEAVAGAMARGALLGARGNSGVILSQFFHGLSQGLKGKDRLDGEDLARAFGRASEAAYKSVSVPVDGTMLTVIRELSLGASRQVKADPEAAGAVLVVWGAAVESAREAVSRTPLQLPVLREAGVVDAGGQGVATLLEGAWHHLLGEDVESLTLELCTPLSPDDASVVADQDSPHAPTLAVSEEYLSNTEEEMYGYCTQFLVYGQELSADRIREEMASMAGSAMVVGDADLVKVHIHARDPGPVISYAVSLGTLDQVSMTDMDRQHQEFLALHRSGAATQPGDGGNSDKVASPAVVAVAWGDGFTRLLQGLGCGCVVAGGQTMNPSTRDLLEAARRTGAQEVILLPNNSNILPAARQAASITEGPEAQGDMRLHVVESRTIPQCVAALLAFNPEGAVEDNLESMENALASVKTVEVTKAVRPVTLGGLAVDEGQYIGLLEGDLVVAGGSAADVLQEALSKAGPDAGQLVTLYWGCDVREEEATEAAAMLSRSFPGLETEVVYGGQPLYDYIASLE